MRAGRQLPIYGANKELLHTLVNFEVNFIIVGGLAVHYHVSTRNVGDFDILIERTKENAEKIISAITSCPLITANFSAEQLLSENKTQIPVKIYFNADILTPGNEIDFYHHLEKSHSFLFDGIKINIASVESLISLLSFSNEKKHINDIALLRQNNANK